MRSSWFAPSCPGLWALPGAGPIAHVLHLRSDGSPRRPAPGPRDGGALIGIGLLSLSIRAVTDHQALKSLTLAFFALDAVGFIISLAGQFGPGSSLVGWANVAIWLLLALGFGYFRFVKP